MKELPKAYEPAQYEDEIYKKWEDSGFFNPDVCVEKGVTAPDADPFSIVLPPPNVTGTLHMGHAVMLAIEDVMVRYNRMKGKKTLWLPGTDHAAIATQEKVERILWEKEKKTRHDIGRGPFLTSVEKFAQESHDTIVNQARKMGASLDWSREAYTLDEQRNFAVRTAFKRMYDDGLIYRGDRIVNWDPKMQSTVSNIEVDRKEEKALFYYFQYGPFVIGTARPETKFGDKYVVMHPEDERYAEYKHGDTFECEWINGQITATVLKDAAVDPEFGTGVMTITPWHDITDFEMAERHNLDKEQVIDFDGKLLPIAQEFAGMHIADARPKIVEKLKEKGLLVRVDEEYVNSLAINSRGKGIIEPQIMRQWWMDVDKEFAMQHSEIPGIKSGDTVTLQKLLQHTVRDGHIDILPERFEKPYFNWVDNLRDWCLSRQLWYGHRIPAWYKGEEVYVGTDAPEGDGWTQDPDTLDTWFSAGLWTFSTLGWPDAEAADFKGYHPTAVLETGYDILTFWVIRMIMMSTYHVGQIPFKTVYLHGMVRDEKGKKMSKNLGNIINPLDMIEKYGTDATRLSLMIGSAPGNDTKLSEEKIAGYRNFTNKLWNISRFMLMNIDAPKKDIGLPEGKTLADKWILWKMEEIVTKADNGLAAYDFSSVGEALRDFTWNDLADWYLEMAKVEESSQDVLNYLLNTMLKLWHPFMPFVTEAVWKEVYGENEMMMVEKFPEAKNCAVDTDITFVEGSLREMITAIRSLRADKGIAPGKKLSATVIAKDQGHLESSAAIIKQLARLESLTITAKAEKTDSMASAVVGSVEILVDFAGAIDVDAEKARLEKEISNVAPYVTAQEKKLSGPFAQNAPEAVVNKEQAKLAEAKEKLEKLQSQLSSL
ncbi:MAG: valine--tRNA ligase [Candidatus Magasanikbacteria bacterium]|jgi:valyl-tRNA synthetase|nr:valine--tRNA ligase [Candidatus Magasanikbacteria bacterium]